MRNWALIAVLAGGLAGCDAATAPTRSTATMPVVSDVAFPAQVRPRGVAQSNLTLSEDFLDLVFELENGERLTRLLRYEAPVRVYLRGSELAPYRDDLENLLARFRGEAGIDIRTTDDPERAQMFVEGVPIRELQRVELSAACFIIPGVSSWGEYRTSSGRDVPRWSRQSTLGRIGVFVPYDTAPQDTRDCLHEEIAQALGPANDLYRLPNTVFNDDNVHSVVTPFDMLILRALYQPELRSGMPRGEVAGRILPILRRINPDGEGRGALPRAPSSPQWDQQIEVALTRGNSDSKRLTAANRAVAIARGMDPVDHRLGFALITRGRLLRQDQPGQAASDFIEAYRRHRSVLGGSNLRTAQAALHAGIVALDAQEPSGALGLAEAYIPVAEQAQNAVLLSSLLAIKARALDELGDRMAAQDAQLAHLKWARYAFGDATGERRQREAALEAALRPQ